MYDVGAPGFETAVTQRSGLPVVAVSGEIDLATVEEFESALREARRRARGRGVVLDLSGVEFIEVVGLNALVRMRRTTGHLVLVYRGGPVARLLEAAGMVGSFESRPDPASAVEAAGHRPAVNLSRGLRHAPGRRAPPARAPAPPDSGLPPRR